MPVLRTWEQLSRIGGGAIMTTPAPWNSLTGAVIDKPVPVDLTTSYTD